MEPIAIRIHKNDNVVTAKSDIDINTNTIEVDVSEEENEAPKKIIKKK